MVTVRFTLHIIILISYFFFLSSCSRDDGDSKDKSKIAIALPQSLPSMHQKVGAFSAGDQLIYAALSVSGPGMSTLSYQWESCRDCTNAPAPPSSFQFDVPGGTGRIFQILAAYESSSTGSTSIYYGETERDLFGGEIQLAIPISNIQQGPFVQGRISGRYLDGPDSGPSDIVDVFFYPPSGRPKLKFETSSITAGWFNFFMIAGANFEFVLRSTGEVLWGQPVNLESSLFDPIANGQVMRAYYPAHVRRRTITPPPYYEYFLESAKILTWGYWNKPASSGNATTKKVCENVLLGTLENNRVYNAATPSSTAGLTVSSAAPPSLAVLANTASPYTQMHLVGGQVYNSGSSLCGSFATSAKYLNYLIAQNTHVDGSGNDNFSGFQGIVQTSDTGMTVEVGSSTNTTTRDFQYKLLPGVSSVVSHARVFTKTGFTNNDRLEKFSCSDLSAQGWTANASATTSSNFQDVNIASGVVSASGTAAILCPMKSLTEHLGWSGHFISSGAIPIPATLTTTWSGTPQVGQCLQVIADLKDSNGSFLYVGANTNFTMTFSGVTGNFYPDGSCAAGGTASMVYILNSASATLSGYFKASSSGTLNVQIQGQPFGINASGTLTQAISP